MPARKPGTHRGRHEQFVGVTAQALEPESSKTLPLGERHVSLRKVARNDVCVQMSVCILRSS